MISTELNEVLLQVAKNVVGASDFHHVFGSLLSLLASLEECLKLDDFAVSRLNFVLKLLDSVHKRVHLLRVPHDCDFAFGNGILLLFELRVLRLLHA